MIKKYKLLKDIPGAKAGTIFGPLADEDKPGHAKKLAMYAPVGDICPSFIAREISNNQEWFELIKEWPKKICELDKIEGYFIHSSGTIVKDTMPGVNTLPTEAHAKSALAFAQLSQLAKEMNGDWVPNWADENQIKFIIIRKHNLLVVDGIFETFFNISFHSREMAEFSLKYHLELWEQYYMLTK